MDIDRKYKKKKYLWNWNFFRDQNEISAYWAGFIMADGCLMENRTNYILSIQLAISDLKQMEMFCDDIKVDRNKIRIRKLQKKRIICGKECYNIQDQCEISLGDPKLPEHLLQWGIVPRKTYNFVKPQIHKKFLPHYLRGLLDGDGNVYERQGRDRVRYTGNKDEISWIRQSLYDLGLTPNIRISVIKGRCWGDLEITAIARIKQFYDILDGSNPRRMERKWIKIENIISKEHRKFYTVHASPVVEFVI